MEPQIHFLNNRKIILLKSILFFDTTFKGKYIVYHKEVAIFAVN